MYKLKFSGSDIEFIGWNKDVFKFLIGYAGFDIVDEYIYHINDFNGKYCDFGTIIVEEI